MVTFRYFFSSDILIMNTSRRMILYGKIGSLFEKEELFWTFGIIM